jgi:AraC-like DNA-binding protein
MPEPTVAVSFAGGLLEFAASIGVSRKAVTDRARLDCSELANPDNRISFAKYVALMRAAQELCGDPAFALHFGESPYAETGIGCVIAGFAESGAEAFALINRYARLNVELDCPGDDRFVLARSGGQVWWIDTRDNPNDFPELTELTFACMVTTFRQHLGENQLMKAVHVTHAPPPYRAEYDRIFRMPVVFGSDRNAVLLSHDAWLTEKPPTASRVVLDILSARAEALLDSLENAKSTKGRVENALLPGLHTGGVGMEAVAAKLGISRQTLFRRLKAEGITFERVLDEMRHKLALDYLDSKNASVNETAYLLGFSDRAAFSRAFKRWTGSSPRRFTVSSRPGFRPSTGRTESRTPVR